MNGDVASAVAWRPTDTAVQLDRAAPILAGFDEQLAELRRRFRHDVYPRPLRPTLGEVARCKMRHRHRARLMNVAIARVAAQLAAAGVR